MFFLDSRVLGLWVLGFRILGTGPIRFFGF